MDRGQPDRPPGAGRGRAADRARSHDAGARPSRRAVIRGAGGVPAFLNYRGYPATLCISVNDVIVHGIPGDVPLRRGDIVGIDCGVFYKGYYGDAARTFAVGEVSDEAAERLLQVTEEALRPGVAQVRPGGRLRDIG